MKAPIFLQQPSIPELLQRAGDTRGEGFTYIEGVLRATALAWDLTDQQYAKLGQVNTFSVGGQTPAVAGTTSIATLQNPAGSGKIFRVRRLTLSTNANTYRWGVLSGALVPALANVVVRTPAARDSRILNIGGGSPVATALVQYATTLGAPAVGESVGLAAGGVFTCDPLCSVAPGGWFYAVIAAVFNSFEAGIVWDERPVVGTELGLPG